LLVGIYLAFHPVQQCHQTSLSRRRALWCDRALIALAIVHTRLIHGLLGVASLIGVIVSHVIVLLTSSRRCKYELERAFPMPHRAIAL
jgi:hypothetical protein